jgi:ATP-dependent helicase/nuclease subunit A
MAAFAALTERVEAAPTPAPRPSERAQDPCLAPFRRRLPARLPAAKTERGWLDFDDLIVRTKELLTAPDIAQWVLFRLDGGIDHILVDEAQDTSPAQWDIVKRLAEDFAAGEGARAEVQRTIFVVGDKKQSIYSFQGADPEGFDRMRVHFGTAFAASACRFRKPTCSIPSAPRGPILELVDEVCGPEPGRRGSGAIWNTRPSIAGVPGAWTSGRWSRARARVRTSRGAIRRTSWASITISRCWPRRWPTGCTRC